MITKKFKTKGMHCRSCEILIEKSLSKLNGINAVKADYPTEIVEITYDQEKTDASQISDVLDAKGYDCCLIEKEQLKGLDPEHYTINKKMFRIIFGLMGIIIIGYFLFKFADIVPLPEISQNMGYGLLFIVGLLTGFHCIGMCGGFVVSYTTKAAQNNQKPRKAHLMYGSGKLVSYTIIGAGFGLLGSIIVFTPLMRGIAGILAGIFLVIFGLNMFNIFPWFRKIRIKTPNLVSRFVGAESKKHSSPLIIGLLNGLMIACGPLQAVYIMAAGTGSMLEGAKLLFIFGLGTLPVMLGFGFFTSFISKRAAHKILKASGVIVIILGLIMINRGLALTGTGFDTASLFASVSAAGSNEISGSAIEMQGNYQIIRMDVTRYGWEPNKFILKKDVPVRWIIDGKEVNGCNNAIQVPKLNLNFNIKSGEQVIEFTPTEEGVISWSCWMGMIPGTFVVKDNVNLNDQAALQKELDDVQVPKGGSCGGSGCGCGSR